MSDRTDLQVLAVLMTDIRATIESMRRIISSSHGKPDDVHPALAAEALPVVLTSLRRLRSEAIMLADTVTEAELLAARLEEPT
jgi:hypothetical protein